MYIQWCRYFDPQYFISHQLSTASDVYSFGVVLLELVTGQKAIDHSREDINLMAWVRVHTRLLIFDPKWNILLDNCAFLHANRWLIMSMQAKPKLRRDGIASIVDPCLKDEYAPDMFFEMADLALKCTLYEKDDRPTMRVLILTLALKL